MSIPDTTYFGPDDITYGDVRKAQNDIERIRLLKRRLDSFFLDQISSLDRRAPFPLAIMCCIALETLGSIFLDKGDNSQSYRFNILLGKVDGSLSNRLSKKFLEKFNERWPEKHEVSIKTRADLIYSYLRNTLMHGYYAQAVYLNDEDGFTWKEDDGFIVINPHWLWAKTRDTYDLVMNDCLKKDDSYRKNATNYIDKMIK